MDIQELAQWATTALAPALPYLVGQGRKAIEEVGKQVSAEASEIAKSLWGKLQGKIEAKPGAVEAANDVALAPDDADAQAALRLQLKKLLTEDESLAIEFAKIWEGARAAGINVTASGDRSVALGGNVSGSNIITGDKNKVGK